MSSHFLNELVHGVMNNLVERLSMDPRVKNIDVVGDIAQNNLRSISTKIRIYDSDTSLLVTADEVIANYFSLTDASVDIFSFYNPLFPFVSVAKLQVANDTVESGHGATAIGGFLNARSVTDAKLVEYADNGIFSVIRRSLFKKTNTKISCPVDVIGLSAIELISLRDREDMDLFGLVLNSGIAQ